MNKTYILMILFYYLEITLFISSGAFAILGEVLIGLILALLGYITSVYVGELIRKLEREKIQNDR